MQLSDNILRVLQTDGEPQLLRRDACAYILRAVDPMGSLGRIGDRGGKADQAGHKPDCGSRTDQGVGPPLAAGSIGTEHIAAAAVHKQLGGVAELHKGGLRAGAGQFTF